MASASFSIAPFIYKVNALILNPIITLAFSLALVIFFFGIFQFINNETGEKARTDGKNKIIYGLVGMFIMFSAYGLINFIIDTLAIPKPGLLPL